MGVLVTLSYAVGRKKNIFSTYSRKSTPPIFYT